MSEKPANGKKIGAFIFNILFPWAGNYVLGQINGWLALFLFLISWGCLALYYLPTLYVGLALWVISFALMIFWKPGEKEEGATLSETS